MGRARAAIVVVVAIAAVSAIVLLSPSPRPLTAPLCDKQPGNGEERSAAIGQAVERALRDAPGDPTQTIVDLGPCFRATDLQANGAAFLRVTRADDAGHEFDLIAYRGDGAWHVRSLLKADVDTHIEIVVSAGAAVDVLFSMSNASSFGPGIDNGWFELHRLTDDLRLIWRSSDYGVADVRVLRNDLMLTTRASEQTLWRRRGDAFEAVLQRTVPSVGRVSGDFLSALRRGDREAARGLATNEFVVAAAAKVLKDLYQDDAFTDASAEQAYWEALPEALRGPLPVVKHRGSGNNSYLEFVRHDGDWQVNAVVVATAQAVGDGGPATAASAFRPTGVAVDAKGNVYIADAGQHRVRRVTPAGVISTVAGTGRAGAAGDGAAVATELMVPFAVAIDAAGVLYIADRDNHRVRRVAVDGSISTVAPAFSASGALEFDPAGLAVDGDGTIYIADLANNQVRQVARDGAISVFAGTGKAGFGGDGGPAVSAMLDSPSGVAVDRNGDVYIADRENHRVRRVSRGGVISTVAGTGVRGFAGDGGPAVTARLDQPLAVAADPSGALFIADGTNDRIRRVDAGGAISTVVGTGAFGSAGDGGPARDARVNEVFGLALGREGTLYLADTRNDRVRSVSLSGIIATLAGPGPLSNDADGGTLPAGIALQVDFWGDTGGETVMTLLTDGRLLSPDHSSGASGKRKLAQRRLSAAGVAAVLDAALASGLFTIGPCCASEVFPGEGANGCCGAGVGVAFTDRGHTYRADSTVYTMRPRFSPAMMRFEELARHLAVPEAWLPPQDWVDATSRPYEPERYKVVTSATWDDARRTTRRADFDRMTWPAGLAVRPFECLQLTPAQAASLIDALRRAAADVPRELPDDPDVVLGWQRFGGTFTLSFSGLGPPGNRSGWRYDVPCT